MHGTLRDRLTKGLGSEGYGQAVNILIQIATLPLLIRIWGVELYGEWLILSAIPVYLTMTDLGFGSAAQNEMTMAAGRGESGAVLEALQSVWFLVVMVSVIVFAAILSAATLLPVADWFDFAVLESRTVTAIILLLSLQVLVGLQTGLIYSGFHYRGSYGFGRFLSTNIRLFEFILLVVAVAGGGGPIAAATALLAGRVVGLVAMRAILWRVSPEIVFGWRHARRETIQRLAAPAFGFAIFPVGNALSLQGMLILVGAVLGPPAVVVFATMRTLTRFGLQLVGTVTRTFHAEISAAHGKNNYELQRRLFHFVCQAALCASVATALVLAVFGSWFLALWTDDAVVMDRTLFGLLLAVMVTHCMWQASLLLAYATNRHLRIAVAYIGVSVVALLSAFLAINVAGLSGTAAVLLVGELSMAAYVFRITLGILKERPRDLAYALVVAPFALLRQFNRLRTGASKAAERH
jgi:O-antigen/teichoic acid export membrane protein